MKSLLVSVLVLVVLFISLSCNESYDYSQAALGLGLRDYSCTEAWIEVQIGSNDKTADIYIKKNDEIIKTIRIAQSDSLFYFDSLQPNTVYKFDAVTYEDGKEVKSNPVTFTTLDTTSHNFTWQTFTFGEHSSSTLYDVAIIDENNIWAVGEIYMNDSLGNPDTKIYNAIHWNGSVYKSINTSSFFPALVNKMGGTSNNDFYIVGTNGQIAHYNGASWSKIESGTTTNINDIWGVIDQSNNQQMVYGAVSFVAQTGDQKILKIQNNKVDSLYWNTARRVHSVWTYNNRYLYAAGGGIFENKRGYWNEITEVPLYYSRKIRGSGNNDIFVCGDFGLFAHFNGVSWQTYNELYLQGIYYSLSTQNNIVVTVGFEGGKTVILKGTRN